MHHPAKGLNVDIKKKAAVETSELHLRDAAEELMYDDDARTKPVRVTVYGPGSRHYQAAVTKRNNRAVDRLKKKGKTDQTAEDRVKEEADFLSSITIGWEHMEYDDLSGHALSLAIYSDPTLGFIGDQVAAHAAEWANFTKGSATS